MTEPLRDLLLRHHVLVPTDNEFQRRARLLQALWREEQGYGAGEHREHPLGSRLAMPEAKDRLTNYLTDTIRDVVRKEVLDRKLNRGKLYGQPRIWNDLLSSQPLCFNLFGELQVDLDLASRVFARLTSGRIGQVTAIAFEHSPGRRDARYTGDRSAFDVFVEFVNAAGEKGFAGIEVKYHEDLADRPAPHRARYDEIARAMGGFMAEPFVRLKSKPLQQIWRDHLLAGSLLLDGTGRYEDGFFVFLHPAANTWCARAVQAYKGCLMSTRSFMSWTLEDVAAAIVAERGGAWIGVFVDRYLAFEKIGVSHTIT